MLKYLPRVTGTRSSLAISVLI